MNLVIFENKYLKRHFFAAKHNFFLISIKLFIYFYFYFLQRKLCHYELYHILLLNTADCASKLYFCRLWLRGICYHFRWKNLSIFNDNNNNNREKWLLVTRPLVNRIQWNDKTKDTLKEYYKRTTKLTFCDLQKKFYFWNGMENQQSS